MISTAARVPGQVVKDIRTATPQAVLVPRKPLWQPSSALFSYNVQRLDYYGLIQSAVRLYSVQRSLVAQATES